MNSARALLFLITLAIVPPTFAAEQLPGFVYQAKLELDGVPAHGNFDLSFSLWDANIGGDMIGESIFAPDYPIDHGVLSINLAFPDAFSGSQLYLQVTVDTEDMPRTPVATVPVAQWALQGVAGPAGPPGSSGPEGPPGVSSPCHGLGTLEVASIEGLPENFITAGETFELTIDLMRGSDVVDPIQLRALGPGPSLLPGPAPNQLTSQPSSTRIGRFSYVLFASDACGSTLADFQSEVRAP